MSLLESKGEKLLRCKIYMQFSFCKRLHHLAISVLYLLHKTCVDKSKNHNLLSRGWYLWYETTSKSAKELMSQVTKPHLAETQKLS